MAAPSGGRVTVTVQENPSITLTLVFTSNGVTLGTITTTSVVLVKVEINGTDATDDETKTCLINGGTVNTGIELEGSVSLVSGNTFQMAVNGERAGGPVTVDTSGASFDCAGVKGTCDATLLKEGARVHVSGTLTSCSMTAAQVKATQIKFQH